jgi:hypothetical protein
VCIYIYVPEALPGSIKALIRQLAIKALLRPIKAVLRPIKAVLRPIKALLRPIKALLRLY